MSFTSYFPGEAHRPGKNERPDENSPALLNLLKTQVKPVKSENWQENGVYLTGWTLLEAEYYWESHHLWEAVWLGTLEKSPEKYMMEGLIQLTNSLLKMRMGRENASLKLISLSESKIREAFLSPSISLMGIEKDEVLEEMSLLKQEMMQNFNQKIEFPVPSMIKNAL